MQKLETPLPGVWLLEPDVYSDPRGFFFEAYHQRKYAALGIHSVFVQDNHSLSCKGTLRGLHYQVRHPQAKLCRVVRGEVLDVVVDIRLGSPHFGRWTSVVLSAENRRQIYIPHGFAHGFLALSDEAEFLYKCDDFYYGEDEYGIAWNDPQLNIAWGIRDPLLSVKDQQLPLLADVPAAVLPKYQPEL